MPLPSEALGLHKQPLSCHQTNHNLGSPILISLQLAFVRASLSMLSLFVHYSLLYPLITPTPFYAIFLFFGFILVLPVSHMWALPSNVEWVWEYGLNVRMENTVCVFTLQCFGLLRQTARQLRVLTPNGKTRGQTTQATQAFSSTAFLNGAVNAALNVAQRLEENDR